MTPERRLPAAGRVAGRGLRADAQRNYDSLLGAACECFAEDGLGVSVDEIARRAGVGHGTAFRRFPTKEVLVETVIAHELDALLAEARALLGQDEPGAAFEAFFRAVAGRYQRNKAMAEGYERCKELPQKAELHELAAALVQRAQKAGALRADLTVDEIFELVPAASRFPDVILTGLRSA